MPATVVRGVAPEALLVPVLVASEGAVTVTALEVTAIEASVVAAVGYPPSQ